MREFVYFIASFAGAALLTALGIIYAPSLGTWTVVAYLAAAILGLCAIALLIDIVRRADRRKMLPLIGMVVFRGGFLGCATWYFWPSIQLPQTATVPPALNLKAIFVADGTVDQSLIRFHLSVTNIEATTVSITRVVYSTNEGGSTEVDKNVRRNIPKDQSVDYPGTFLIGPNFSRRLTAQIEFSLLGSVESFVAEHTFFVPPDVEIGKPQNPIEWDSRVGTIDPEIASSKDRLLKIFGNPTGTIDFTLAEKTPTGDPNIAGISGNGRFFVFDPKARTVSFTVVFAPSVTKSVTAPIPSGRDSHRVAFGWDDQKQKILLSIDGAPAIEDTSATPPSSQAQGGKGGSGEIFGNKGTIIGGKGGSVGPGGIGRGGEGGGGVIHGDGGTIIGGEGGSVDGTNIWYPPAVSGYIQYLESQGQTPDFGVQQPGEGGATGGWLQRQAVVAKIREEYFRKKGQPAKIQSSKIGDVPLDYINEKLKEGGYPWRARIEKKYWYLYYVPTDH